MNTMNTPKPPWGDETNDPWKDFDAFSDWALENYFKDIEGVNLSDIFVKARLYNMCIECFQAGLNLPEPTEPITDYLQDLG